MHNREKQPYILAKILSVFLLLNVISSAFLPSLAIAQTPFPQPLQPVSIASVVTIPMIAVDTKVLPDMSRIDWDQMVTINGKEVALNSDEALNVLTIPHDIKALVQMYRSDKTAVDRTLFMWPSTKTEKKERMNDGLAFSIAQVLIDMGELPPDYFDLDARGSIGPGSSVLNIASAEIVDPIVLTGVEPTAQIIGVTPVDIQEEEETVSFIKKIGDVVKGVFEQLITLFIPENTYADAASVSEDAINYLIEQQNEDGSWGTATSTQFIATAAALEALQAHGVTGTTTDTGIAWLSTYFADNTDYFAQKIDILLRAGEATTTAEFLLSDQNNSDGGFRINESYQSDPLTTARVIQALHAADYRDSGAQPHTTASLALHYLINTKRQDNGWSVFPGGVSTIPVTSEVIEALLLWKHRTLGAIEIDDTLDPAVSTLMSTQIPNGTWGNDLLNTALAYHAIKASGENPTHQLDTVEYFENEQEGNGSFDNDIYKTAKVLKALSIATDSGELLISDIIPTSTLETGLATTFKVRITNPGNTAVDTGKLHFVTDNYHFSSFDFEANDLVINANSTVDLAIGINNTRNFQGDVVFKTFIEGTNDVIHQHSRYEEVLSYAADPAHRPGLPMYSVTYKNVSSAGAPAITWRWPIKHDPNLKNIVLLWRVASTTTWSAANVTATTTATSATLGGLANDTLYEATLGTSDQAGNIFFFSGGGIATVKTNSSVGTYTDGSVAGIVKALDGIVPEVDVIGVTASTTAHTAEDGTFLQEHMPWGTGYARVSDFRYENYVKKYATADTNITDVSVYTNLRPDTADPTVTDVSIVGESDYVMENEDTKLIQYTVGDDIGPGGGVVESASFYYYDPDDSDWHLIGTEDGLLTGTRTHAWTIPDNLLGTGYKIKVTVRDFAGKDSEAAEWGPFELTAGNAAPSLTFTAPVSGVSAEADLGYTITWTDADPDSNATTTLSYDPDNNPANGNHTLITTVMEDDPANAYVWHTFAAAPGNYYIRAALNDGGGEVIAYSSGTVTVVAHAPIPPSRVMVIKDIELVLPSDHSRYALTASSTFYSLQFPADTFTFDMHEGGIITLISSDKKNFQNPFNIPTTCEATRSVFSLSVPSGVSPSLVTITPSGTCSNI